MARGRHAENPTEIPPVGWKDILLRVKDELSEHNTALIAAGVAFYALLAVFPGIAALVAIAGLVTEPSIVADQIQSLGAVLPKEASQILIDQATEVAGSREGGLGFAALLGILLAAYSASKGMSSLMTGLNVAYNESESRGFIRLQLWTFGLTLLVIFGMLVAIATTVILPAALSFIGGDATTEWLVSLLRWPLLGIMTILGLSVIYRYGPSRDDAEWAWVTPGAVLACVLWVIGSAGFAWYVSNFGSYNETFGTLGGVIVLLTWLWLSAYIVLLGAELDGEMEAQTRHDTTVGQPKPMGERDATKADNLGEAKG